MTRATRQQFADLDFGEGTRPPAYIVNLPEPDESAHPATKRYVDATDDTLAIDVARIKTALFMFFGINVDELDPLPEFLTQP